MVAEPLTWLIEELNAGHDRSGFFCGHDSLDQFLKQYAGQNQKSGISRTFVAIRPGMKVVCGYYSLAAGSVNFASLTEAQRKRLPRYPLPVIHLGRLAVDRDSQGKGLGEFLLIDAFARIAQVEESAGIHAVEVVAIDAAAKKFYLKYGFTELQDDPHHLFMPLKLIRKQGLQ